MRIAIMLSFYGAGMLLWLGLSACSAGWLFFYFCLIPLLKGVDAPCAHAGTAEHVAEPLHAHPYAQVQYTDISR